MGYNGGINKRGYHRRKNGMYSKSSMKSGSKIISDSIFLGLGLLSLAGKTITDIANNSPTSTITKEIHFSPKKQRRKFIIYAILSILCPIAGCLTYIFADWFMFFSVVFWGFIEICICSCFFLETEKHELDLDKIYYIYEDEKNTVSKECETNLQIFKIPSIILFILNLYPILLYIKESCEIYWNIDNIMWFGWDGGDDLGFTFSIVIFKIMLINPAIIFACFTKGKRTAETYDEILPRPQINLDSPTQNTTQVNNIEINSEKIEPKQTELMSHTTKLSKCDKEYIEDLKIPYGKLHIGEKNTFIQFYFPGPDAKHKGTFFSIKENDIDNFIEAYRSNWNIATELYLKIKDIPNTTIKQIGKMNMNVIISNTSITLYLHKYHLPVRTEKECEEIINLFLTAKHRIKEIQAKLFT